MPTECRSPTLGTQALLLWVLLGLSLWPEPGSASLPLTMDNVIRAVSALEDGAPRFLRTLWPRDPLLGFLLGAQEPVPDPPAELSPELRELLQEVAEWRVRGRSELGVVLAPDGSTVAVQPLLAGLLVGLAGRREEGPPSTAPTAAPDGPDGPDGRAQLDGLVAATLGRALGLAFLRGHNRSSPELGVDGCWDRLSAPRNFTLLEPGPGRPSAAFLSGALDGLVLGDLLGRAPRAPALARLLAQYYGPGVRGDPALRSAFRRQRAAALLAPAPRLARRLRASLLLLRALEPLRPEVRAAGPEQLAGAASRAAEEFVDGFLGCPALLPRCRWSARPYRGRPSPLRPPLEALFVHHTAVPSVPCGDFARCAADMRAMQRFHQDVRGWDDIGYSFVVGADGYVYEGRGWHWVGAHTKGYNSRGLGVALLGDFSAALPDAEAQRTVRELLPGCAVRAGLLRPDFVLLGHRQLGATACPGDALFRRISTWPHFSQNLKPVPTRTPGNGTQKSTGLPP